MQNCPDITILNNLCSLGGLGVQDGKGDRSGQGGQGEYGGARMVSVVWVFRVVRVVRSCIALSSEFLKWRSVKTTTRATKNLPI